MLRMSIITVAIALGIYAVWDLTRVRPLEPTIGAKWQPVAQRPQDAPGPQMNGGLPPWNENESIFQNSRNLIRKSTLEGLDRPWGSFCDGKGHQALVNSVSHYFGQRSMEEEKYPKRWATPAATTSQSNGRHPTTSASNGWCKSITSADISIFKTLRKILSIGFRPC